jgi:threonine synthase
MEGELVDRVNGKKYSLEYKEFLSPDGNLLDLDWDGMFDIDKLHSRKYNLWRYKEALPIIDDASIVSFQEGFTPMVQIDFGGKKVWVKQEQLFSTGSYKDRGATVLISHAKYLGVKHLVQDSSGNAGCAIAAYAGNAQIECNIYLQDNTSAGKVAQMRMYGANIHSVHGSREDAAKAALIAAKSSFYASHCYNPFFFHGTKTFAYEVCEQLNWNAPATIILPAGNGTLIIGCYIGFMDLLKSGIIHRMPKIIAVQSANCAPLAQAFFGSPKMHFNSTLAEGIAIAEPIRGSQIMEMVKSSGGTFVTVSEHEIKQAWMMCGRNGFYIEPTSAATIAGMMSYIANYDTNDIVTLFSGHGLKSTEKAIALFKD